MKFAPNLKGAKHLLYPYNNGSEHELLTLSRGMSFNRSGKGRDWSSRGLKFLGKNVKRRLAPVRQEMNLKGQFHA